jgi:hypothetical protein
MEAYQKRSLIWSGDYAQPCLDEDDQMVSEADGRLWSWFSCKSGARTGPSVRPVGQARPRPVPVETDQPGVFVAGDIRPRRLLLRPPSASGA